MSAEVMSIEGQLVGMPLAGLKRYESAWIDHIEWGFSGMVK